MRPRLRRAVTLTLVVLATSSSAMATGTDLTALVRTDVTVEHVTALAQAAVDTLETGLEPEQRSEVATMAFKVKALETVPPQQEAMIADLVNRLTMALASARPFAPLTVAAARLVLLSRAAVRPANLFAACLQARGSADEAVIVLEYLLAQEPDSDLLALNLANAALDADADDRAKKLLDALVARHPDDRAVWKSLAGYWFRRGDSQRTLEALMKAAAGGVVRHALSPKAERIRRDEVEGSESLETMEAKLKRLATAVPTTTADIVGSSFPDEARRFRDEYGRLKESELLRMPRLPQVNTSNNREFTADFPVVEAWIKAMVMQQAAFLRDDRFETGIRESDSDEVKEAKGRAAGMKYAREQMQQAGAMLKMLEGLKGMPGMKPGDLERARRGLAKAGAKLGVDPNATPAEDVVPFFDEGSPIARANYADYTVIAGSYQRYVAKAFTRYGELEADLLRVYTAKLKEENNHHDRLQEALDRQHEAGDHGDEDIPCLREKLRHKKKLNEIGDISFKNWVNLYCPFYAQKMKPALDAFWAVAGLYVKTMNHPGVKKREFLRVKEFWINHAVRAVSAAAVGDAFTWEGPTDEEEEALQQAMKAAEERAKEKTPEFERAVESPTLDWMGWIEKYLRLQVSVGALTLKLTASTIEFGAALPGVSASISFDAINSVMETSCGPGGKFELGVSVAGMDAKIEGSADAFRKSTRWDFENGTYAESWQVAKGEISGSLGPASAGLEMTLDAQLQAQASAKAALSFPGGFTREWSEPVMGGR